MVGAMFYYALDRSRRFELESKQQRITSLVLAAGGFVALTLVGTFAFQIVENTIAKFSFASFDLASAIRNLAEIRASILFSQVNPALAGNLYLNLLTFGLVIAVIETIWLIIFYEMLLDATKTQPRLSNLNTWFIIGLISAVFTILHFTSLGVDNNIALTSVFIFSAITLVIATVEGQMLGAILFHILANTTALLLSGRFSGLLDSPELVTIAFVGISAYILTRQNVRLLFSSKI